jgi:hypothetical protein
MSHDDSIPAGEGSGSHGVLAKNSIRRDYARSESQSSGYELVSGDEQPVVAENSIRPNYARPDRKSIGHGLMNSHQEPRSTSEAPREGGMPWGTDALSRSDRSY